MNRRNFLGLLAAVPGLGFLKPERSKLKLTEGTYGPDDFGSVPVQHKRAGIVTLRDDIDAQEFLDRQIRDAVIVRSRICPSNSKYIDYYVFSPDFAPVRELEVIANYQVRKVVFPDGSVAECITAP